MSPYPLSARRAAGSLVKQSLSLIFLLVAISASLGTFFYSFFHVSGWDAGNLWSAACLASSRWGRSCEIAPEQALIAQSVLRSYPPWSLPYFLWMGLFDKNGAFWVLFYLTGSLFGLVGVLLCYFAQRRFFPNIREALLIVCAISLYFPVYNHLAVGQLEVFQLTAYLIFLILLGEKRYYLSGTFFAIAAIKPQFMWLICVYWFLNAFKDRALIKFLFSAVCTILLSSILGWYFRSGVVPGVWPVRNVEVTTILQPNLGSYLVLILTDRALIRFLPSIFAIVALFILRGRFVFSEQQVFRHLLILTPLSLLAAPYSNIYDFIIMIPTITIAHMLKGVRWADCSKFFIFSALCFALSMISAIYFGAIHLFIWLLFAQFYYIRYVFFPDFRFRI
jgi:hypothetical protein